jgi:F-type H+-transporting ATPase subunit gamma
VIGKKAKSFCRLARLEIYAEFSDLPDKITYPDTLPISKLLLNGFLTDEFQSVHLVHMESVSTLSQKPVFTPLLPISPLEIENPAELVEASSEYLFEPDAKGVLNWLLPYFVENVLYFAIIEGKASEHSSRMIAMKNASDNAKEIVNVLNLEFNRSRQAHITQELQEITTATLALGKEYKC